MGPHRANFDSRFGLKVAFFRVHADSYAYYRQAGSVEQWDGSVPLVRSVSVRQRVSCGDARPTEETPYGVTTSVGMHSCEDPAMEVLGRAGLNRGDDASLFVGFQAGFFEGVVETPAAADFYEFELRVGFVFCD